MTFSPVRENGQENQPPGHPASFPDRLATQPRSLLRENGQENQAPGHPAGFPDRSARRVRPGRLFRGPGHTDLADPRKPDQTRPDQKERATCKLPRPCAPAPLRPALGPRAAGPRDPETRDPSRPSIPGVTLSWDPKQYLRYDHERERPFGELLARIEHPAPREVVDLGCGPGTTTSRILDRWPNAHVVGVDNSPEMISHAQPLSIPGRLEFRQGDLREWRPDAPVDVLLSTATLQWVPDHESLFPGFVGYLAPGGSFAFQVPANFAEPSHTLLYELARSDRWESRLGRLVRPSPVLEPPAYLSALLATGARVDVWETTYFHILLGADAVLDWVRGSALRPFLTALSAPDVDEREEGDFLQAYAAVLRAAYPRDAEGRTIFPFRRIFGVATVAAEPGAEV
jgi:trans-aconitate 2-methyltransferase